MLTILVPCNFTRMIFVSTLRVLIRPQWTVRYPQSFYIFTLQIDLAFPLGNSLKLICQSNVILCKQRQTKQTWNTVHFHLASLWIFICDCVQSKWCIIVLILLQKDFPCGAGGGNNNNNNNDLKKTSCMAIKICFNFGPVAKFQWSAWLGAPRLARRFETTRRRRIADV